MISRQNEKQLADQVRLLAREYCDGAFNKAEYRRRRRALLGQCLERDPYAHVQPSAPEPETNTPESGGNWTPYLMVATTGLVLALLGFVLVAMV